MSDEDSTIASDGYLAIEFGRWAKDKLSHLEKYCAIFTIPQLINTGRIEYILTHFQDQVNVSLKAREKNLTAPRF